ncbi:MAG TPA: hypothetical protein VJC11_03935 [Patescibacteria group bacterium]|nr:hypothetical protein [Patescibacteria group bacterium]
MIMKIEFLNLSGTKDEAYVQMEPEDESDQIKLREIYDAGFASGSGALLDDKDGKVFSHLYVAVQKRPKPPG